MTKRLGRNGRDANTPYLDVRLERVARQYSEACRFMVWPENGTLRRSGGVGTLAHRECSRTRSNPRRAARGCPEGTEDKTDGLDVTLRFGGYSTYGCRDFNSEFTDIEPLQLSWGITRLIWIGHIKGRDIGSSSQGEGNKQRRS